MELQTEFEESRGITRISVEHGFAQVHVSRIPAESRLSERTRILGLVAEAGINVRFPKLTPSGLLFLIATTDVPAIEKVLIACVEPPSASSGSQA
jgi:hypothetical protein